MAPGLYELVTNRLAVADGHRITSHACNTSPGSPDVTSLPLRDIWQKERRYMLAIAITGGSVGTTYNIASTTSPNGLHRT